MYDNNAATHREFLFENPRDRKPSGLSLAAWASGHNRSHFSCCCCQQWRKWQLHPAFLPGESNWWRSLVSTQFTGRLCVMWMGQMSDQFLYSLTETEDIEEVVRIHKTMQKTIWVSWPQTTRDYHLEPDILECQEGPRKHHCEQGQ